MDAVQEFYLPEDPAYTILQSAADSARFTLTRCLAPTARGHLAATSSFVDETGAVMEWHDFGPLEGPGWAANAVGGAWEIWLLAGLLGKEREWRPKALAILDHVLEDGFLSPSGMIYPYRHTGRDELVLNFKANDDWLCPGSMARIAVQLLRFADELPRKDVRRKLIRRAAQRCGLWLAKTLPAVPNGWYPRRITRDGTTYLLRAEGGEDPFWQTSADGLFIVQLYAMLTECGLGDYAEEVRRKCAAFVAAGGIFGSINHDTYDAHENVAYSVAFRVLSGAARLLRDEDLRRFAYDVCLAGLEGFEMREDRNGCATKGLLWMEASWDTAYLWEAAEAAQAYLEASLQCHAADPRSVVWERKGLTLLRAVSRHHHGEHGFLTEGVDWNNHVGEQHHFGGARYGDIRYTEPFLNNQHIVEPTVFYLEELQAATTEARPRW